MKDTLNTDKSGCPRNLFTFVKANAEWIAEATTRKSASTRARIVTSHIRNHSTLIRSLQAGIIGQVWEATDLAEKGINL